MLVCQLVASRWSWGLWVLMGFALLDGSTSFYRFRSSSSVWNDLNNAEGRLYVLTLWAGQAFLLFAFCVPCTIGLIVRLQVRPNQKPRLFWPLAQRPIIRAELPAVKIKLYSWCRYVCNHGNRMYHMLIISTFLYAENAATFIASPKRIHPVILHEVCSLQHCPHGSPGPGCCHL